MSSHPEAEHCPGCSCSDPPSPTQETQQLVKTAMTTTASLAEAVRVQSQTILALIERDNQKPEKSIIALAPPEPNHRGGMVISERVGFISVEQWDGMSDGRLQELDRVLKKIMDTTMLSGIGWVGPAVVVRDHLAAVGFVFKTWEECLTPDLARDWTMAGETALPYLVRMRAVASASRPAQDGPQWWADEMMRIVVRLMELRGM